jgi:hypothetical protein
MVHFLRNKNNFTIIECDVHDNDLSTAIDLLEYSEILLGLETETQRANFIDDMNYLNEIRRAWWEDDPGVQTPEEFATDVFSAAAKRWDLIYVTD